MDEPQMTPKGRRSAPRDTTKGRPTKVASDSAPTLTRDGIPPSTATQFSRAKAKLERGDVTTLLDEWYDRVLSKGQLPISAVFEECSDFLKIIAEVHDISGAKYPKYLWRENPDGLYTNSKDALIRHCICLMNGEQYDPEAGLPHLWQLLCRVHMAFTTFVYLHMDRTPIISNWIDDESTGNLPSWVSHATWPTLGILTTMLRDNQERFSAVAGILYGDTESNTTMYIGSGHTNHTEWLANVGHNVMATMVYLCSVSKGTQYSDETFIALTRVYTQIVGYVHMCLSLNIPDDEDEVSRTVKYPLM